MSKPIAKIKLAPGNVAWYDPLNNIYLTINSDECIIYDTFNLTNIKKGIKYNILNLQNGDLIDHNIEKKQNKKIDKSKKNKSESYTIKNKGEKKSTKKALKKEIKAKDENKQDKKNIIKDKTIEDDNKTKEDKIGQTNAIVKEDFFNANKNKVSKKIE